MWRDNRVTETTLIDGRAVTALDTGFATAMHVKPRWLRDIVSMLFSGYYLLFANEADEKVSCSSPPWTDTPLALRTIC